MAVTGWVKNVVRQRTGNRMAADLLNLKAVPSMKLLGIFSSLFEDKCPLFLYKAPRQVCIQIDRIISISRARDCGGCFVLIPFLYSFLLPG